MDKLTLTASHFSLSLSIYLLHYRRPSQIVVVGKTFSHPSQIVVVGKNFRNSTGLKCLFASVRANATYLSNERVSCVVPPRQAHMGAKVALRLASEGGISSSWKYFEYVERPQLTSFDPAIADSGFGEAVLTVRGSGFRHILRLMCAFGLVNVRATVVSASELHCQIPRHPPGVIDFHIIDQYKSFTAAPRQKSLQHFRFVPESSVYSTNLALNTTLVRGTNFNTFERSTSASVFGRLIPGATVVTVLENKNDINSAIILQGSVQSSPRVNIVSASTVVAPNGTTMSHNITLCPPGTFNPQAGFTPQNSNTCLRCPIGFMCPLFGLIAPILCPAGAICERLGLVVPSSLCVNGHYCDKGTKTSSPISQSTTVTWILEEETGVLTTAMTNRAWDYIPRTAPATGERRIFHPPVDAKVKAEQPFPCPIGFFCREGHPPMPCTDGYFCPR